MGKRSLAKRAFDALVRASAAFLNYLINTTYLVIGWVTAVGLVITLWLFFPEVFTQEFAEKPPAPPAVPTR